MRKKLLLINLIARWINRRTFFLKNYIVAPFKPLNLAVIAALTPDDWEAEVFDEIFKPFSYRKINLVGITSYTGSVFRAPKLLRVSGKRLSFKN